MSDNSNFTCQRCKLPLSIDVSLTDLSKSQTNMLLNNGGKRSTPTTSNHQSKDTQFIPKDRLGLLQRIQSHNKHKEPIRGSNVVTDSFVILPQFVEPPNSSPSIVNDDSYNEDDDVPNASKVLMNRMSLASKIFHVVSSKSSIDYPICMDCSDFLLNKLKQRYDKISRERDIYLQFLDKLQNKSVGLPLKSENVVKEIENLREEEKSLLEELEQLEAEKSTLLNQIKQHDEELIQLQKQKEEESVQDNLRAIELNNAISERDRLTTSFQNNMKLLERLRKINIYNETFQISHNGPFGTINSLRLGSLPDIKVPWQEINAAMGDVVLLLSTITTRLGLKLKGYKLRPMGSVSKIEKYDEKENAPMNNTKAKHVILECYSSGEYQIERLFNHSKFDDAMLAILSTLKQIINKLKELDSSVEVPYQIEGEKIGGLKVVLNSRVADDEWTGACKFLLTDLKWVLAYSSVNTHASR